MTTPVIFRIEGGGSNRDVIAFFPHNEANRGKIVCYVHLGQHGEADHGYYQETRAPTLADAKAVDELRRELVSVGYDDLREYKRLPVGWRDHAWNRS